MAVLLAKRALPRSLSAPPAEVAEELARLPLGFGQQARGAEAVNLNLKKRGGTTGAWRLRVGDWRVIFFPSGDDFLVAAIGLRKDIYERAARMRLARRGEGLTVIEAAAPAVKAEGPRSQATSTIRARRPTGVQQNRLSPFDDAMLRRIDGVGDEELAFLRSLPATVDAPTVLAQRIETIDLAKGVDVAHGPPRRESARPARCAQHRRVGPRTRSRCPRRQHLDR